MARLNHLIMAFLMLMLLLVVNQYLPLEALINLIFNCLMIVIVVIYIMQFLGVVRGTLPAPKLFK
ncbi:MAG: Thivi_2564 family membrane protein [Legionella sp.]